MAPATADACGGDREDLTDPGQWGLLPITDATTGELATEVLLIPPEGLEVTAWVRVYLGGGRSVHTEVPLGLAPRTDVVLPLELPAELGETWARISVRVLASDPASGELHGTRSLQLAAYAAEDGSVHVAELSTAELEAVQVAAASPQSALTTMATLATQPDEQGLAEEAQVLDWLGQEVAR